MRLTGMLATAAALGVLAVTPAAVSATTTVLGDPGGGRLANNSTLTAASVGTNTMWFTGLGLACHPTISLTVPTSHSFSSVPATLTSLTFAGCKDTIGVFFVDECSLHAPRPTVTITAGAGGGTVTFANLFVFCNVVDFPGMGCYWRFADAAGTFVNSTQTLSFNALDATHTVPSGTANDLGGACGSTATFWMDYSHVHTTSGTTVTLSST
jgi:hypothetical protein